MIRPPKPFIPPNVNPKRLPQRKAVTIAIGTPFSFGVIKGALVCADSLVVATDGATTFGTKTHLSITQRKSVFAIAGAADDGDASNMLAGDITSALCKESVDNLGKV